MAVQPPFKVEFGDVFPQGAFAMGVEAVTDFDKQRAGVSDMQARDKASGERMWVVRVVDGDPEARSSEVKVKIAAAVQPVPPEALPGVPFRPVEFEGLQVIPYIKEGPRPKVAYSLRATGMRAPGKGSSTAPRSAA